MYVYEDWYHDKTWHQPVKHITEALCLDDVVINETNLIIVTFVGEILV